MVVRKTHIYIALVAVVVLAAFFAQRYDEARALKAQKELTVSICMSTIERAAYVANGFHILQQRTLERGHKGDALSARNYEAVADSIISTFPGAASTDARVDRIEMFDGRVVFRIPDATRAKERKGCESLPPPTP